MKFNDVKKFSEWESQGFQLNDTEDHAICLYCHKTINFMNKGRFDAYKLKEHSLSKKHQKNKITGSSAPHKQISINTFLKNAKTRAEIQHTFNIDLTRMLIETRIPFYNLEKESFKLFIEKWTAIKCPNRTTISKKYIETLYEEKIEVIKSIIKGHMLHFQIDEATDSCGRAVISMLVCPLTGNKEEMLLFYIEYVEETNSRTIQQEFLKALQLLFPGNIPYDILIVVTTDQASYMLKAFKNLKEIFSNLKHITCLAHAFHLVCENMRNECATLNEFIYRLKSLLGKSRKQRAIYSKLTSLPLPPKCIITRWGNFS